MTAVKISVLGADRRFEFLKERLSHEGHTLTQDIETAELVVSCYPFLAEIPKDTPVAACGPKIAPETILDIMKDETYLEEIAYLTAEGAIASAMAALPRTIKGARCMVVGWGRIGRALTYILKCMGADVTALTRGMRAEREIHAAGAAAGATQSVAELIHGHDVVFSTPPSMVIDRSALECAGNAIVIDLASPPYGVDIEAARDMGVRAWREPALPGRYCPVNAADAIFHALVRGGAIDG